MSYLSDEGIFKEVLAIIILFTTICYYIPILILLIFRRKTQPIRHRSPYLLLTSLVSSFLLSLSLSMILFLNTRENNVDNFTCNFYIFNVNVLHFILILPYIFRAYRLVNVFNLKFFNTNYQRNKLRESYYLKILAIVFICLVMLYIATSLTGTAARIFPVEIQICSNNQNEKGLLLGFRLTWMVIHGLECFIILVFVIRLKPIRDEFTISKELVTVCCMWLGFELLFLINSSLDFMDQKVVIIIDIIRNYLTLFISGFIPLRKSFQSLNLPICTTKECAANFSLLLITEKTYDAFHNYLKASLPEGAKFLSFWTELNVFKHSNNSKDINMLATDVYEKYLNENSELYIDFPAYLVENIHKSYKNSNKNSYSEVFDSLGDYVYSTLRDYYYPNFKMSEEYRQLELELEKDEIVYSRLVASSMISSLEIE